MKGKIYDYKQNKWIEKVISPLNSQEVLIEVKYVGVNRADILQARGLYPPPKGYEDILGLECSGIIIKIGENVPKQLLGKKVMTLLPAGAYSTFVKNNHQLCIEIPENISLAEAAAIPEAIYTAYLNLIFLANMKENENILIYGAAGGLGTTIIQLVNALNSNPIAIVGNQKKKNEVAKLNPKDIIIRNENLYQNLLKYENNINIIWDIVASETTANLHLKLLSKYGKWLLIGLLGKNKIWKLNPATILTKNITIFGSTLRNRPENIKILLTNKIKNEIIPLYKTGKIKPIIYAILNKNEVFKAFEILKKNEVIGKIVLKID